MASNYDGLREKLSEAKWPAVYMFKFIVPADNAKIAQVQDLFDSKEAQINMRKSKTGKFVSISAKELMLNVDSIIERYKSAEKIEGLIAL